MPRLYPARRGSFTLARKVQILLGLILVMGVALPFVRQIEQRAIRMAAPQEIQQILEAQVEAWNRGDLEGFMSAYWKSDSLRFHSGNEITLGWQPTYERYQKRYKAEGKQMGNLTFSELHIEAETHQMAWARGRWKVVIGDKTFQGLFTLILRKFEEGWLIVYDHTSAEQNPSNGS
ncbi:MAG: nuclear transport factor 2 family protein [Gemmataceae bacterium]|nr:nuclear transport factor 2 family protein [Gemmataceae bacterium]